MNVIDTSSIVTYVTALFIVINPMGNAPAILALISPFPLKQQKMILAREWLFSMLIALFFQYCGELFLSLLQLQTYTIALCGGIILFLIGLNLIFPKRSKAVEQHNATPPFFVPIATPLLTGAGGISIVMLYAQNEPQPLTLTLAIFLAWILIGIVMAITPYLQRLLGDKGVVALEQLMGMVLTMIATQLVVTGLAGFIATLHTP